MLRRALVLAAGKGRRLNGQDVPSPLAMVGGIPLIKRTLRTLEQLGFEEAGVVIGYRGEEIRRWIALDGELSLPITWIENPDWNSPSASSLIKSRSYIDESTLVLSAELIFGPEIVAPIMDQEEFEGQGTLLIDRKLSRIYDLGSILKVQTDENFLISAGQDLEDFDAVSTGISVINPELIYYLEERSECSHNTILNDLAKKAKIRVLDINGSQWQEVHSPETKLHAEWLLRAYGEDLSGHAAPLRTQTEATVGNPQRTLSYIEGLLSEKAARHYILFNPGPVLTSPRVKSALVHYDVCHRDGDYSTVLRRIGRKLRRVCRGGPEHDILILSGSGTAAMEATLASCVPPDGKLLVVSNGAFGERFAEIAEVHNLRTVHLSYAWGELMNPDEVARILDKDPAIVATIMCHHETSVGLLNPIRQIGEICRQRDCMFFVDAVSSLAGEDLDVRRDNIDVLISSANKCLHAISGVSFVCVHKNIWPRIENIPTRTYYLDLKRYHRYTEELSQTPFTPAVSNIFALDAALDELLKEGLTNRIQHYHTINDHMRSTLTKLGLEPFTNTGFESHTICTVKIPTHITFPELYEELKSRGYIVYACKDSLKDRFFQIANMGDLSDEMIQGFLDTLGQIIERSAARAKVTRVSHIQLAS